MTDHCFHCGEPIPAGLELKVKIDKELKGMCCLGCQAVTEQIIQLGFNDYYKHRTEFPEKPESLLPEVLKELNIFNNPQIQTGFVDDFADNAKEVRLIIEGITCPACTWLIESRLSGLNGVQHVDANYSTQRCRVRWQDDDISLSEILSAVKQLGYKAYPFNAKQREQVYENERKNRLLQLGIAGLFGMQVMMIAIALYSGDMYGIDARYRAFFQWISLLLTLPVLIYSGRPLFAGAIRDIKIKHPGMDIPITLGITIAFISSLFATIQQSGHIYYDSIVMFIFFILGGRYFEFISRKKSIAHLDKISSLLPLYAHKINTNGEIESVVLDTLKISDKVLVKPGEVVPIDGKVYDGCSSINESIITGESMPKRKQPGSDVIGGSTNIESPLYIEITRIGEQTFLSNISRIIEKASSNKARTLLLAEKLVSLFIVTILIVAGMTGFYWFVQGSDRWLEITISVLVVSCPCALSLAMPTAVSSATSTLIKYGIAIINNDAIEKLNDMDCFVFDKTGTLTEGILELDHVDIVAKNYQHDSVLKIAASLESASEHPIAKALCHANKHNTIDISQIKNHPGQGICGKIKDETWCIGTKRFLEQQGLSIEPDTKTERPFLRRVLLANATELIACFYFTDNLRDSSIGLIQHLRQLGKKIVLLSGDQKTTVANIASQLGIKEFEAGLKPDDKLNRIAQLQQQGSKVCMIGDGINDAPAFAQADVAIAMTSASDITKLNASLLLLNNQIESLQTMLNIINKANRTMRINLGWAISYNLIALPFAVAGYLAPWMAALGMSLSSLVVVLNATRISTTRYTANQKA